MDIEGILAITLIFGGGTAFLLSISPVGRAIADRIRGSSTVSDEQVRRIEASNREVLDELEALRREMGEVHERIDFTERMITQSRQAALPPHDGTA